MNLIRWIAETTVRASVAGKPFDGIAYSGGMMNVAPFGPLVIDLSGCEIPPSVPMLANHENDLSAVCGQGEPSLVANRIAVRGTITPATDAGKMAIELAATGFSFQLSIGCVPIESRRMMPGESIQVNGQTIVAPSNGLLLVSKSRLREISLIPNGADHETYLKIAARLNLSLKGNAMSFEDFIRSLGLDPATISPDLRAILERVFAEKGNTPPAPNPATPATTPTPNVSAAASFHRFQEVEAITAGLELSPALQQIRSQVIAGNMSADFMRGVMHAELRAGMPAAPFGIVRGSSRNVSRSDHIAAALMVRAGFEKAAENHFGPQTMEQSRPLHRLAMIDLCRAALQADNREVPSGNNDMIRAAVSTGSMPTALGNAANKILLEAYKAGPATWRSWASVQPAKDFKEQSAVRPSFLGDLQKVNKSGEIKHGTLDEAVFNWSIDTYAKLYIVDRKNIVNDDLGVFEQTIPAHGRAALRAVNDLVYKTLLDNAATFFTEDFGNLIDGVLSPLSATSLQMAYEQLRKQKDQEGNSLDLVPAVLLVPPELEATSRALLQSLELNRTGDKSPTGNPWNSIVALEVEPRLSNATKFSNTSETHWFLFASPQDVPMVVGFLNGNESPTVETFGLDHDANTLAMKWRVYFDFGAAMGDYRAGQKSAGA